MVDDIERLKAYLNKGYKYDIKDESGLVILSINLKPLPIEFIPELFMAQKIFLSDGNESDPNFLRKMSREDAELLISIVMKTLETSLPNVDVETRKQLASSNFLGLLSKIFLINTMTDTKDVEVIKKVEHIRTLKQKQNEENAEANK